MTHASPLLLARLRPPPLRAVVMRAHLLDRLDTGCDAGLSLIVGPAGFGKTTLAAAWLERLAATGTTTGWLALSEAEQDPARFLAYLVAALRRLDPAIGADFAAVSDPVAHEATLIALLNDLTALIEEQPERRFVLAIDDLHLVESAPVDALLSTLALHVPPGLHLILISRIDPAIPLTRLRVAGRLTEIRERDLRFNRAEAGAFFSETMGLHLEAADVATIQNRTEGWVAGLQLAALAIRDGSHAEKKVIADFAASHRYVLDYLSDEVLRGLPPETVHFLLTTAPLNRMCAALCDSLREASDSGVILAQLEQSNLFVVPLDTQGTWYRYHHLFADLLRREAGLRDPQALPVLHQRASDWYAALAESGDQDALAEALHHAAAAPDMDRLADLLDHYADQIWQRGELDLLRKHLIALPPEQLAIHPVPAVHLAWIQITTGNYQAGETSLALIDAATASAEVQGRAATCRAFLATFRGRIAEVAGHARQALELLEPGSPWRGAAAVALGDALSLSGNPATAADAYTQALEAAATNGYVALNAGYKLAGTQRMRGQLHAAADTCSRWIRHAERTGMAESALAGCVYGLYGDILAEWDRLPEALEWTARAVECLGPGAHIGLSGWIVLYRSRCLLLAGDYAAATATVERLDMTALPPWLVSPLTALRTLILLAQGQIAAAQALLNTRPQTPGSDGELLLRARMLAMAGNHADALVLLDRGAERCRNNGLYGTLVVIELARCTILQAAGRRDQAVAALRAALIAGAPGSFRRSFRDAPPVVLSLLDAATPPELKDYVNSINVPATPAQDSSSDALLSEREREVLALIAAGLKNREIAERLMISLNTVLYHSKHLYSKLGVASRTQVLQAARERGLL